MALEALSVAQGTTNRIKENKTNKKRGRREKITPIKFKKREKKFMMFSHVTIHITTIEYRT